MAPRRQSTRRKKTENIVDKELEESYSSKKGVSKEVADELHKDIPVKFQRRHIMVKGIDDVWAIDLIDMTTSVKKKKS